MAASRRCSACPTATTRSRLVAVLADDARGRAGRARARGVDQRYPSLTPDCPQAQPVRARDRRAVRRASRRAIPGSSRCAGTRPITRRRARRAGPLDREAYPFFRVEGDEVHEVAVGPVHAGIIEPGHFRFQATAKQVFPRDLARLPAPRRRAAARDADRDRAILTPRRSPATRRSATRPRTATRSKRWRAAARRRGRRRCAASRWSSSGWPTTSATSAPGRRRRLPADGGLSAAACAATS